MLQLPYSAPSRFKKACNKHRNTELRYEHQATGLLVNLPESCIMCAKQRLAIIKAVLAHNSYTHTCTYDKANVDWPIGQIGAVKLQRASCSLNNIHKNLILLTRILDLPSSRLSTCPPSVYADAPHGCLDHRFSFLFFALLSVSQTHCTAVSDHF